MADTYKILAQTTAADIDSVSGINQANVVYTVPGNTQSSISSISLVNTADIPVEYSLGFVKAEDVDGSIVPSIAKFIVLGSETNKGVYSSDGITWTELSLPTISNWVNVVYGNGKFVSVSYQGLVAYSEDGVTWSLSNVQPAAGPLPDFANQFTDIAYGNGKFVATLYASNMSVYSIDGINWVQSSFWPVGGNWASVIYGGDKFVAVANGSSDAAYSTDGINWMASTLPAFRSWSSVTYGNGKFLAVPNYPILPAISSDGIVWQDINQPQLESWQTTSPAVAYGASKFVMVGASSSEIFYSLDGINWIGNASILPTNGFKDIFFADNKFIVSVSFHDKLYYSNDGITWTMSNSPMFLTSLPSIGYGVISSSRKSLEANKVIIANHSISANMVEEISGGITLSAGDQIRVYSDSSDLIVQVYGVEI